MLDIFRGDAFGVIPLSLAINNLKFVPGFLSQRGLFTTTGIASTTVTIEERNYVLTLISPTPRGGPGHTMPKPRRSMRALSVPHFEINDAIMAEEVQGVRPFAAETGTESVMMKVGERMQTAGQSLEYTQEYSRVGAVKGIVTYADGTTLDLYAEYGLPVPNDEDFTFDPATSDGSIRKQCANIIRQMGQQLDGVPFTGVEAIVGDDFFDAMISSAEVRATYLATQDAAELRSGYIDAGQIWGSFPFGGILWTNYRGYVGGVPMIETNMAYFYPTGVPSLFATFFAPADYIETVNTIGIPRYVKQYAMPNDKGIHIDTQMNALNMCTRPRALLRGKIAGTTFAFEPQARIRDQSGFDQGGLTHAEREQMGREQAELAGRHQQERLEQDKQRLERRQIAQQEERDKQQAGRNGNGNGETEQERLQREQAERTQANPERRAQQAAEHPEHGRTPPRTPPRR